MKLRTFLVAASAIYFGFGVGLAVWPAPLMSIYGLALDSDGQVMARILGTALIGFALLFWWLRDLPISGATRAALLASLVYNVLDVPIIGAATLTGVMAATGWQAAALHLFLAIGFGYFSWSTLPARVATKPAGDRGITVDK